MYKLKIGVIGAGWWATENHIPHLLERSEVELTSVCKLEEDQLKFVKEKFGFKFASTNYNEMLQFSDLDGVIISSPHHAHFENAKASLEKKCHVMIEKPMTTNVKDAEILIELAKKYFGEYREMPNSLSLDYLGGDFSAAKSKEFIEDFKNVLSIYGMT